MNKKIALENLILLDKIFKDNRIEYWLSCGTLLGFYRQNDFIAYDGDTDVCINIRDLSKELIQKLIKTGFEIKSKFGTIEDGFEIAIYRRGVKTDLFFFYKHENYWYHSVYADFSANDSLKYDYVFKPFGLKETEFLKYSFTTPDPIEDVLVQQYGSDWNIPKKDWSYYKSPKNVTKTNIRIAKKESNDNFNQLMK